ncbi:MAG: PxKF domain-containing protein [bacterium]|nr:PxKF domain-containing protein [bacterium]
MVTPTSGGGTLVSEGNKYLVDPVTGETAAVPTPGSTRVNFLVEPLDVYVSMVDEAGNPVAGGSVNFYGLEGWTGWEGLPITILAADGWYVSARASLGCTDSPPGTRMIQAGMINEWELPDGYDAVPSGDGSTKLHVVVEPLDVEVSMVDHAGNPVSGGSVNLPIRGEAQGHQSLPLMTLAADGWWLSASLLCGYSGSWGQSTIQGGMINEWHLPDEYLTVSSGDGSTKLTFVVQPLDLLIEVVDASQQHNPLSCGQLWVNPWATPEWLGPLSVSGTVPVADGWWVQVDARVCQQFFGRVFKVRADHTQFLHPSPGSPWDPSPNDEVVPTPGLTAVKYVFDVVEPSITIVSPLPQAYPTGELILFEFSATTNSGAPITSVTGIVDETTWAASGEWYGFPDGEHVLRVRAEDANGNCACKKVVFEVGLSLKYLWLGFLPPLTIEDKAFKQKSTIPVKFRISDLQGNPAPDCVATLAIYYLENSAPAGTAEVVSTAAGDLGNQFRYDPEEDLYIFNLSTKPQGYYPGWTYEVVVTLDDGQEFTTTFALK